MSMYAINTLTSHAVGLTEINIELVTGIGPLEDAFGSVRVPFGSLYPLRVISVHGVRLCSYRRSGSSAMYGTLSGHVIERGVLLHIHRRDSSFVELLGVGTS